MCITFHTASFSFIEKLFPEQCMPKGSNNIPWKNTENHLRDKGIFSPDTLAWRDCPNLDAFIHHLEGQFGGFINTVAEICGEALGSGAPHQCWTAKYSTNVLGGHQANRKPDLTLIDQNTSADWRCVPSFGEMKSKKNTTASLNELCDQISVKSAILFGSQDNRNFVIALGFAKYNMIVYRYDHGGLMCSAAISITHPTGWTFFARVAYRLAYCHPNWLGYDISAKLAPCRGPRLMAMQCIPEDKTNSLPESCRLNYAMDAQIHLTDSLFGHGSNDTWHNVHQKMTEGQILCVIAGIANIPELVEEYVISQFQSRAGLAHREVFQTFKVLHRDIHIGNLYVKTETGNDAGDELGDWGFAECQDLHIMSTSDPWDQFRSWAGAANPNIDLAERTGNTACISVRLMYAAAVEQFCPHEVCDDLESFFYAIVIIMVAFHEASKQKSAEELEETMLADHWWNQQHWRSSAEWKVTTMKQDTLWKSRIAPHIGPYFDCFKPVVDKMHKALFHQYDTMHDLDAISDVGITYEEMIGFLSEMVEIAQQEEEHSDRGTPAITEVTSSSPWEESYARFFSLLKVEVSDDIDPRSIPEDKLALRPTDVASYTPTEVFKISLVLNAVAATSELPEGDVQPEPINEPPSRAVIKQTSRAHPPATISTGNLPTEESTVTDPVTNPASNVVAGSTKCKAPEDVDNHARKKSHASEQNSLADEGGKKSRGGKKSITSDWVKKSHTSDGAKKKSVVVGVAGKKSGTSHSRCNEDEDYVPVKASTPGKRKK
ncbi:hypothetical protein EV702DRAFT_1046331 [Suillus placidus]|uniref:Fungal-type protein kinase domain-containing protein n=1 Tax=Suillus placidus TaxID=48579 RepID=A0A9P6ZTD5_9AGAM|nr:hypothetical protein EV702DRAFT_1046331 [Suillus placidus]